MTEDSVTAVLAMSAPSFSGQLLDETAMAGLMASCRRLPITLSTFWGVETELGHPRGEVDLLMEIKRDSPGHRLLAGTRESSLDALCDTSAVWSELRRFARVWADEGHRLRRGVRNVWLEFDLIKAARAEPAADALQQPCVFWGPEPGPEGDQRALLELLDLVGTEFAPFPAALPRPVLDAAARALPQGAHVFQVGAMQSRGDVVLRLCVKSVAASAVPGWLASLGWDGDAGALEAGLRALDSQVRTIAVDVDITAAGIGRKVGLECYLDWSVESAAQWGPLLDHVSARGLCCETKREAVLAFPARTAYSLREQLTHRRDGFHFPVLFRNIHHLKLAFVGDAFTEAKAYLGVHRPGVNMAQILDKGEPGAASDGWLAP